MARKVLIRAGVLMLLLSSVVACAIALVFWHHRRLVTPCPAGALLHGEPVACVYRIEWTGGWPMGIVLVVSVTLLCLLSSWLWFKLGSLRKKA